MTGRAGGFSSDSSGMDGIEGRRRAREFGDLVRDGDADTGGDGCDGEVELMRRGLAGTGESAFDRVGLVSVEMEYEFRSKEGDEDSRLRMAVCFA